LLLRAAALRWLDVDQMQKFSKYNSSPDPTPAAADGSQQLSASYRATSSLRVTKVLRIGEDKSTHRVHVAFHAGSQGLRIGRLQVMHAMPKRIEAIFLTSQFSSGCLRKTNAADRQQPDSSTVARHTLKCLVLIPATLATNQ
jgi:hypothetical protein